MKCVSVCSSNMINFNLKLDPKTILSILKLTYCTEAANYNRRLLQPRPRSSILDCGIYKKLPEAYRKFYTEWKLTTPKPVHFIPQEGKYFKDKETGEVTPVKNIPIPLSECEQENYGIWGGEAVIDGYVRILLGVHRVHDLGPAPRFWYPKLRRTVIYSEVLDEKMFCDVTKRAIILINDHFGLDNYLLETRACDLRNLLALKLKRKILQALLNKTLYPNDAEKREEVYNKYKKFLDEYTAEEIDWYGLSLKEARIKLAGENLRKIENSHVPLKHQYRREFIEELKNPPNEEIPSKPWYKRKLLSS